MRNRSRGREVRRRRLKAKKKKRRRRRANRNSIAEYSLVEVSRTVSEMRICVQVRHEQKASWGSRKGVQFQPQPDP